MVLLPLAPGARVRLLGDAPTVNPGGTLTVRESVALADKLPEVPVMVMVAVPVAAVLDALSVSVLALVVELGLNEAVTPLGKPEAESATLPLNPP